MFVAAVPVTPVNKHTDLGSTENNVRFALNGGINIHMLSESQSESVKFAPQLSLRRSVEGTICLHHSPHNR